MYNVTGFLCLNNSSTDDDGILGTNYFLTCKYLCGFSAQGQGCVCCYQGVFYTKFGI